MADNPIGVAYLDFRANTTDFIKSLDAAGAAATRTTRAFIESGQQMTNAQKNALRSQERVNDAIFALRATAEQKELRNVDRRHRQLIAIAKKYGVDTTGLQDELEKERLRISEKYAGMRESAAAAEVKKRLDAQKRADDIVFQANASEKDKALRAFDERNAAVLNELRSAGADVVAAEKAIAQQRRQILIQHGDFASLYVKSSGAQATANKGLSGTLRDLWKDYALVQGAGEAVNSVFSDMGIRVPGLSAVMQKLFVKMDQAGGATKALGNALGAATLAAAASITFWKSVGGVVKEIATNALQSNDAWVDHAATMKKMNNELAVLNGTMTKEAAAISDVNIEIAAAKGKMEEWARAREAFETGGKINAKAILFGMTEEQFSKATQDLQRHIEVLQKRREILEATPASKAREDAEAKNLQMTKDFAELLKDAPQDRIKEAQAMAERNAEATKWLANLQAEVTVKSALFYAKSDAVKTTINEIARERELMGELEAIIPVEERMTDQYAKVAGAVHAVVEAESKLHNAEAIKERAGEILKVEYELAAMMVELTGDAAAKAAFYFDQRWKDLLQRAKEYGVELTEEQEAALAAGRAKAVKEAQEKGKEQEKAQDKVTGSVKKTTAAYNGLTQVINNTYYAANAANRALAIFGGGMSVNDGRGFGVMSGIAPWLLTQQSQIIRPAGGLGIPQGWGMEQAAPTVVVNNETPAGVGVEWRDGQLVLVVSESIRRDGSVGKAFQSTYGSTRKVAPR